MESPYIIIDRPNTDGFPGQMLAINHDNEYGRDDIVIKIYTEHGATAPVRLDYGQASWLRDYLEAYLSGYDFEKFENF